MVAKIEYPKTELVAKSDKAKNFIDRINFIKYWAIFIKSEDDLRWSKAHADFIDAQFDISRRFYAELLKTEEGEEKFKNAKKLFFKVNRNNEKLPTIDI